MKKIICLLLAVLIISMSVSVFASVSLSRGSKGEEVFILQNRLRELGYVSFRATGNYSDMTYNGVAEFQRVNDLSADGIVGDDAWSALFKLDAKRVPVNKSLPRVYGPGTTKTCEYGWLSSWAKLDPLFPVGTTIKIIDFNTSISFYVTRTGGTNHADVEIASSADKEKFLKCFKGYTWEKRAFVAEISGELYAASLFGMPNANDVIPGNDMEGSLCLYFNNSKSDIGTAADAEHNQNIERAAGLA
ncbi:MAG: peptidoglycan-binding protein [Christensenellaceae bacterium]|nr:peptidoglycan-binding protein [Christensenellaceae bacterium]